MYFNTEKYTWRMDNLVNSVQKCFLNICPITSSSFHIPAKLQPLHSVLANHSTGTSIADRQGGKMWDASQGLTILNRTSNFWNSFNENRKHENLQNQNKKK